MHQQGLCYNSPHGQVLTVSSDVRWTALSTYKKLSCRRETAPCFVSLNISPSLSRSFEIALSKACVKSLLVHCNYKLCRPMYLIPFLRYMYSASNHGGHWNVGYGSFKVIENVNVKKNRLGWRNGTNRTLGYGFLVTSYSNYNRILCHFRNKAR